MARCAIIGAMLTLLLVSQAAWGIDPNYYVSPDGNDAWNGEYPTYQGGVNGPKATIQAGINVAGSGSEGNYKFIHVLNDNGQGYTYDVNSTILLDLYNYQEIIFYEDVVVKAGNYFDAYPPPSPCRPFFKVRGINNIRFTGYEGAAFRMTKRPGHETYNGSHAIWLWGVNDVEILGLILERSRGDGILIKWEGDGQAYSENIEIRDVDCNDNSRNGISVISVNNLTIENCILRNTSGATLGPCAGIDFECNSKYARLANIVMRNCVFENNSRQGICVSPHALDSTSENISLVFEDCYITGGSVAGLRVSYVYDVNGSVEFKNITVEDAKYGALLLDKSCENGAFVYFTNCVWQDIKTEPFGKPVYIKVEHKFKTVNKPGGAEFIDCQVYDDADRPAIECIGASDLYEVHGDLYVINPNRTGDLYDWHGATLHDVDITVQRGIADFLKAFGVKNSSGEYVAVFDNLGNLALKGTLEQNSNHPATGHDEFRFQDSNDDDVAIIDTTDGDMFIKGTLKLDSENNWVAPTDGDDNFRIQSRSGNDVAYISKTGDLYLKGELYEDANP
jgi:hypothetical protein